MRSNSEPDPARAFANPKTRHSNVMLKPCIKKKAKSTTVTPPGGLQQNATDAELKTLRRVKTVDFEENGLRSWLSLSQVPGTKQSPTHDLACDTGESTEFINSQKSNSRQCSSCPNTMNIAKGTAAEPATTRTDVHVIAIAPSRDAEEMTPDDGADPATPTMQIIETKSGSYEVVWDDVPPEHSIRTRGRRSSSASHALETASPSAKRGLERVNSKLAGWSGTWNTPSDSFKPTIVVFPDDDGRATRYDCTVDDDEDLAVTVPPNSRMTSGAPSCVPSRPASAPLTRAVSCEDICFREALQETPPHIPGAGSTPHKQSLVVPSVEIPHGRGKNTKPAAVVRKRIQTLKKQTPDFATIATLSRLHILALCTWGGVSPELFAHRDSVSIGKKRMHARNHATTAARSISRRNEMSIEALGLFADEDNSVATLSTVKEHAAHARKNSSSPSILHPPQQMVNKRHIRIVE